MKHQIYNLIIEVTRKCQFTCDHCLRGRQQNKDMRKEYIDILCSQVEDVSMITFTGGEPSMNCEIIEYTLKRFKQENIAVGSFYIATNGYKISEAFIMACLKWYSYCGDKEMCSVQVSNDMYHANQDTYTTELLDGLSFFSRKYAIEGEDIYRNLISEGYAKEYNIGSRELEPLEIKTQYDLSDTEIYLNCNGQIINGCDWSYSSQNTNKLCHVSELSDYIESLPEEDE